VQTPPRIYIDFWGRGHRTRWGALLSHRLGELDRPLRVAGDTRAIPSGLATNELRGSWSDPDLSHRPGPDRSTSATQAEATRAAHHFGIGSSANIQIIVALPHGGTCNPYHHWDSEVGLAFVAYPYNGDPGCAGGAQTVRHEIAEAMTDPRPFSGWTPEVADPCDGRAANVQMPNGKSFSVQELWSNSANRCVLTT
jgi:hypothetical protein